MNLLFTDVREEYAIERHLRVTKLDLKLGYNPGDMKRKIRNLREKMYTFHVIIIASENILDKIEKVTYRLPAWPNPVRELKASDYRMTQFELKELAWGDSTIYADVKIEGQEDIVKLWYPITLSEESKRLVLPLYE